MQKRNGSSAVKSRVGLRAKKVALELWKKYKSVKEIAEITGLSDQTVRDLFRHYDKGGIAAIKPQKRGRKLEKMPS